MEPDENKHTLKIKQTKLNLKNAKTKIMNIKSIFYALIFSLLFYGCATKQKKEVIKVPVNVELRTETLKRIGKRGDNWCTTWAKDGSQITSMCDGNWLDFDLPYFEMHNHLFRITGGPDDFERRDLPNYPNFSGEQGSWFGYGIIAIDEIIYSAISKTPGTRWSGPFTGVKLLKSADNGDSWYRVDREGNEILLTVKDSMRNVVNQDEMFSLEEFGIPHQEQIAYPFSFFDFVQNGQNNSSSKDDFIYMYSPESAQAHQLNLARVHKDKLGIRSEWQYFTKYTDDNQPVWSNKISDRGYVHEFPVKSSKGHYFGWYSWLPSVVWNEGLGLYIMVNGGTYAGYGMTDSDKDYYDAWMHTKTGSLGFWYSEKPYGPWKQFFYTDYWTVDDEKTLTYQPKLSPKWISEDGTEMILIWSDAMKNKEGQSHLLNYKWNQMKIKIVL